MEKLHPRAVWLFFARYLITGGLFLVVVLPFLLPPLVFEEKNWHLLGKLFDSLLVVFVVYVILSFLFAKLSWYYWRYELSEDSMRIEKGIIWKKYVSIPYERVQNVEVYRGVLARLLGLSDLRVQTAGYSGRMMAEGRLPGLSQEKAEQLREELVQRVKAAKESQGL